MNRKSVHSGISLIELMIVIGVMAILMGIAVPAVKGIMASFDDSAGARPLINAALSAARSMAIREQAYAGVRFQENAEGDAFIVFIVNDPESTGLVNGFRAVVGRSPMKLPADTGVLVDVFNPQLTEAENDEFVDNSDEKPEMTDCSTFSVIFSPAGKLTVHQVRLRNKDGYGESDGNSRDPIFNIKPLVDGGAAMFYQDDYPDQGFKEEKSVSRFILYSKKELNSVPASKRYSNYFKDIQAEHISSYTGELVVEYRE